MKKKKFNKNHTYIFVILFLFFLFILFFSENLNTQTSDENEFRLFLNLVIQNSQKAKDAGYEFIKKYPNSSFVPDVLYYLSFVEQDYFQNIINLKKVILYYPLSIWRESSLIKILSIYLLHNNSIQFEQWYNYYNNNLDIKNRKWEVELLYLKNLYKNKKLDLLNSKIDEHLKNANNYQLISYCIFLKGILLKEKDLNLSKKMLLCGISMFPESNFIESFIYELYRIGNREEKPYYANLIISKKLYLTLSESEKEEIKKYASFKTSYSPKKLVINEFLRDYYYILIGYSSDLEKINEIKESFSKLGILVNIKKINESIFQIYIGYFHFKSEAQDILEKISNAGYTGQLMFVDYTY
ncbi:MAG TPA: hypothetical protein PLF21_00660 [Exilispira sp.]|nr:hypothetical protein [Exilispira sp.]